MHRIIAIVILLFALSLSGCGATHHFVPRERIPYGEGRYSLVWSYDLNGMGGPTLWPALNLYMGIGHDYAVGLGYQTLLLAHLSLVKYDYRGSGDYGAAYLHVNNLFAANNCPQIELGGSYFQNNSERWQSFSAGLGFGLRRPDASRNDAIAFLIGSPLFLPHIKYAAGTNHWAASYIHHFGLRSEAIEPLRAQIQRHSGSYGFVLYRDSIESVRIESRHKERMIVISLRAGDTVTVSRYHPFTCMPTFPTRDEMWLASKGFHEYQLMRNGGIPFEPLGYTIIDIEELYASLSQSDSTVLQYFSPSILTKANRVNTWRHDHSLGIVFTNRTPQKDE